LKTTTPLNPETTMQHKFRAQFICLLMTLILVAGCKKKRQVVQAKRKAPPQKAQKAKVKVKKPKPIPKHKVYATSAEALQEIIKTKPTILAVGEIHQLKKFSHIPSAIKRFHLNMLGSLKGKATDLIVETWRLTGNCDKKAKKVIKKVQKVIKRPKKTENQVVNLIVAAKKMGIQPHILFVHCKTYHKLMAKKGNLRYTEIIRLVTRLLREKAQAIVKARIKRKQQPRLVVYGGALHNNLKPEKGEETYVYAPKLDKQVKGKLVELDLYVPEYIENDPDYKDKGWFPLLKKHKSTKQVVLITRSPKSYIILLPRTKPKTTPKK